MSFQVELPHVGESVTEAVIGKWLIKPGDQIEKYDPLVEVITDKVNMDVPSPATGTLTKILAEEGETVLMGAVIAELETGEESAPVTPTESSPAQSATSSPSASRIGTLVQGANVGPTGGEFLDTSLSTNEPAESSEASERSGGVSRRQKGFSPVVTRLAAQHGIDLNSLVGTGLGGRVTKKDVMTAVEASGSSSSSVGSNGDEIIDPTPIRKMIADHMVKAMTEIPHAWSAIEVDVTGMVEWRAANKDQFEREHGVRITYLPMALAVVAGALREHPRLNSSWVDGKILLKTAVNVGVAVAAEEGLVVPVVHGAADASTVELAQQLDGVVKRARSNSMTIEDVQGGTFTLNNTGALGSVWGGAIINHPQAAILTTEAIVKRPVVITENGTDSVVVRSMMNICLSFDHRIIDGAEASQFLQAVKSGLEAITSESDLK
ncbi:dihydrolipoamide acetyltransferase family protein [Candidatus Lucifugimonas marina]|uniref:Dihydrolipoamide acetyltransferase component of pyruvate dehydrogenase complex n=1 Tax=Candidatus Lucifugimonas marina TaxID=3038979 RepID=A0AAJ5ZGW8_9CHLR|nr:2-oxo acid dehydrogenase subunit E2 [SAR202 cluster bacterium JH702]MDG0868548.1 2-oxo acid dehydrogenase subunit E2 [SAR202 cluster bacterium JH639]WFG35185.1 2-oxo acid dehydrogenase subunit E2 [SAR202 cluster bacterium JH545]WFG39135.1 2-oxo acid dehydrogenase subunit E2 [SAR202 cluster bacterium JH1073]